MVEHVEHADADDPWSNGRGDRSEQERDRRRCTRKPLGKFAIGGAEGAHRTFGRSSTVGGRYRQG